MRYKKALSLVALSFLMAGFLIWNNQVVMSEIMARELEDAFSGNRPMLVYFGFEDCPWCKEALPIIKKVAKAERVQLFYFDTAAEENQEYYATVKRIICAQYDFDYVLVPFLLSIQADGEIGQCHMGTVDNHNAVNEIMTAQQATELEHIYAAVMRSWKESLL